MGSATAGIQHDFPGLLCLSQIFLRLLIHICHEDLGRQERMSETHSGLRTRVRAAAYDTVKVKGIGRPIGTHGTYAAAAPRAGARTETFEGARKHGLLLARRQFLLAPAQDLLKNSSGMAATAQTGRSAGGSSPFSRLKPGRLAPGVRP